MRSTRGRCCSLVLALATMPLCGFVCVDYYSEITDGAVVGDVALDEDAPALAISGTIETSELEGTTFQYCELGVEASLSNGADESGYLEIWKLDAPFGATTELHESLRFGEAAIPGRIGDDPGTLETFWFAYDYPVVEDAAGEFHLVLTLAGNAEVSGELSVVGSLCSFAENPGDATISVEVQP